ncbi:FAD binding domain-containing protein [Ancylobacter sp. MQZ15Z-1]|uniref:FAD binding domain-containing protein n=1 Tax=Ancylobacter mangrovi TaxID=2972472 RepID=A0A9X2T8L2_9HYPH|nr:FAD binding domain-containing protein [Ancylobacter mangrovi]MCS0497303.1 FAD binding domain-containing protein [Ancylobacter mangrovi]
MKPAVFDYARPGTLVEAARLLADTGAGAKAMAGSQSLGPMMNLRLARPGRVVDLTAIPALRAVTRRADALVIGACVTHADIEDGRVEDVTAGLLPHVAGRIAYRAVRNRGTLGGSLAHADPAADWLTALSLVGAVAELRSPRGGREVAVSELMVASFTTVLEPDEIIAAIRVPVAGAGARWGWTKLSSKVGEFAHGLAGVFADPGRGTFRAAIGALDTAPIVIDDAAPLFGGPFGERLDQRLDEAALDRRLDERDVVDDYVRAMARVALARAAAQASARQASAGEGERA